MKIVIGIIVVLGLGWLLLSVGGDDVTPQNEEPAAGEMESEGDAMMEEDGDTHMEGDGHMEDDHDHDHMDGDKHMEDDAMMEEESADGGDTQEAPQMQ